MNCPFCQTENPDSAVYCKNCGKPMSGMLPCPTCGEEVPADGTFCIRCGARLAPAPAAADAMSAAQSKTTDPAASEQDTPKLWQKILTYVGGACAVFAALCALIFTFCLGCSIDGGALNELLDIQGMDLYYYFGDAYTDLNEALIEPMPTVYAASLYVCTIFGTLISVAALITVPVLFIVTLVRYIRSFSGKAKNSATGMAAKTYFVFLAFALLFLGLHAATVYISSAANASVDISYNISLSLSGATTAGIALGAIAITLSAACNAVSRGVENKKKPRILQLSFYVAAAVLSCIAVSLLGGCLTELIAEESGNSIRLSFGFMQALSLLGNLDLRYGQTTSLIEAYPSECMTIIACSVLGFILLIALMIMAALLLSALCKGVDEGTASNANALKYAILCTIFALLVTVCAALLIGNAASLVNLINEGTQIPLRTNFTPVLAAAVLFAVTLIILIVYTALSSSKDKEHD